MRAEYKACGAQLDYPPEARGVPWDEWIKAQPIAARGAVAQWLKEKQAEMAEPKKKTHSGAVPANTEWL